MSNTKLLTANQKAKEFPILIEWQQNKCVLCGMPFEKDIIYSQSTVLCHLNDNEKDNRIENHGIAHRECNLIMRYFVDYKIKGSDALRENIQRIPLCESETNKITHASEDDEEWTEGQINKIINDTTKTYLEEKFAGKIDYLNFKETLDSITFLIKKETNGRGSQPAVRRTLDLYCCPIAHYQIKRDGGKRRIFRRNEK